MAGMTPDVKKRLSEAAKRNWQDPEKRARAVAAMKGKQKAFTPERRAAISAQRKAFWVRYRALRDAAKAIGGTP